MRIKLINIRSDIGDMFGVGTIKEDYLGYAGELTPSQDSLSRMTMLTSL